MLIQVGSRFASNRDLTQALDSGFSSTTWQHLMVGSQLGAISHYDWFESARFAHNLPAHAASTRKPPLTRNQSPLNPAQCVFTPIL